MIAAPLSLYKTRVKPEWVDYNNHLNDGYYLVIFSLGGVDAFMNSIGMSDAERRATLLAGLDALIGMLQQPKQMLDQTLQELAASQMRAGLGREESLALLGAQRDAIYHAIEQADLPAQDMLAASRALEELGYQIVEVTIDMHHHDLVDRLQEANATQDQLRELSTPIIPLYAGVLAVPLVGRVDSQRAQTLTEAMLEAIAREQAEIVLLDITGVAVVDTNVANHLLQTARAASLLSNVGLAENPHTIASPSTRSKI